MKTLSDFESFNNDEDADNYLRNKALRNMDLSKSITYVSISRNKTILGYYTIGISFISIGPSEYVSAKMKRKMRFSTLDNNEMQIAPVYLIGQLARSKKSDKGFGETLLLEAMRKISDFNMSLGCNTIRIDCKNTPKLINYYEKNDFIFLKRYSNDELNVMIHVLTKIECGELLILY